MIKEIPILFNTQMVLANKEGRKHFTRRIRDLKDINACPDNWELKPGWVDVGGVPHYQFVYKPDPIGSKMIKCPYGQMGDLLWVRETFYRGYVLDENDAIPENAELATWYFADTRDNRPADMSDDYCHHLYGSDKKTWPSWKPSIHMPKDVARIWLENADVRVERLHNISEEDAIAEGIMREWDGSHHWYKNYLVDNQKDEKAWMKSAPKQSFETLWKKVNGEESWKLNPYVWVIAYKILSTTGKPDSIHADERSVATKLDQGKES